jgi:hypothetical protein
MGIHTFQTLQDSLDGAGATAAGHGHIELVLVVGHGCNEWDCCKVEYPRGCGGDSKRAERLEVGDVRRWGGKYKD